MSTIVTIGGGENGRPGTERATKSIDQYIVASATTTPNFLFIPTASSDHPGYVSVMEENYSRLGCTCDSLLLQECKLSPEQIQAKIERADIIYVGGGNTQYMMNLRKQHGVDVLLRKTFAQEKVLCGLSAGSICWFAAGQSDSRKFGKAEDEDRSYIQVEGLGFIPAIHTPHFDVEAERKDSRPQFVKDFDGLGIAIDNGCALVSRDQKHQVISSIKGANAYKCYRDVDTYYEEKLPQDTWMKLF